MLAIWSKQRSGPFADRISAYRAGFLQDYVNRPHCQAERLEALEQLRALWYDYRIHVAEAMADMEGGVDTEEDLARVEALLRSKGSSGNRD